MSDRNDESDRDTGDQVTRFGTHLGTRSFAGEGEHPLPELVAAFARGELTGDDETAVERHLLACDRCAELLGELADDPFVAALRRANRAPTVGDPVPFLTDPTVKEHSSVPTVPGYELLGELGRGAMGVVYKARHLQLNRLAAIKMIVGGRYHSPAAHIRFAIEAEAVAALDHPNVVHVHEFGAHEGLPYFALEYVAGGSLAEKLARDGKPTPRAAAELVVKLADGVAAAHAKGIVHRDLKPANILLTESGAPKVADFGLAKVGGSDLTATGAVMGTPSYMSPEQAAGRARDVGTPSDVYALGAILYELLTGKPPFKGDSVMDTLEQVRTREPVRPRAADSTIPRDLETICLKCLQKDPSRRYGAATELGADLRAYLDGRPILARPAKAAERAWKWVRRNKVVAGLLAFAVISLLGGGVASAIFAYDAYESAGRARTGESNAVQAQGELLAERAKLLAAQAELKAERERLLDEKAGALLALFLAEGRDGPNLGPWFSEVEGRALWDLARSPDRTLRVRFVRAGLRDAATARRFLARADQLLPAALGVDSDARREVESSILAELRRPESEPGFHYLLVMAAVRCGRPSPEAARYLATRIPALARPDIREQYGSLADAAARVAAALPDDEARRLAETVAAVVAPENSAYYLRLITPGLIKLFPYLPPGDARKHATAALDDAVRMLADQQARFQMQQFLPLVVEELSAHADPASVRALLAELTGERAGLPNGTVALTIGHLAPHISPTEAAGTVRGLTRQFSLQAAQFQRKSMATAAGSLLRRVEPAEAGRLAAELFQVARQNPPDEFSPGALPAMSRVAEFLPAADADALFSYPPGTPPAFGTTKVDGPMSVLAAAATRVGPEKAQAILKAIAQRFSDPHYEQLAVADSAILRGVLGRVPRAEATAAARTACRRLEKGLTKGTDVHTVRHSAAGIADLAEWLEPSEAEAVCQVALRALVREIKHGADPTGTQEVLRGLARVSCRLPRDQRAAYLLPTLQRLLTEAGVTDDYRHLDSADGLSLRNLLYLAANGREWPGPGAASRPARTRGGVPDLRGCRRVAQAPAVLRNRRAGSARPAGVSSAVRDSLTAGRSSSTPRNTGPTSTCGRRPKRVTYPTKCAPLKEQGPVGLFSRALKVSPRDRQYPRVARHRHEGPSPGRATSPAKFAHAPFYSRSRCRPRGRRSARLLRRFLHTHRAS